MVILIGGAGCTGKTLMAQRLLERHKIPYLSIDHLKMGLIRGSRYCDFTAEDPDDEIAAKLWPVIKGIIMTNVENGQHLIIEGCYLMPGHVIELEPEYLRQTIAFWLGFSESYIANHLESGIVAHRAAIEQRGEDDGWLSRGNLLRLHSEIRERCAMHQMKYFEITDDYSQEMDLVHRWVDEQVARLRQPELA